MLQNSTIHFLKALKKNNNKAWFDANRKPYEAARNDFASLVNTIIEKHGKKDATISMLSAKDCLFRINRDVRFSKDKRPYKENFGASINPGGKKSSLAGYYINLQPGDSFSGGGIWMPMPDILKKVRQEIDYNFNEFKKIIQSKSFKAVYGSLYTGEGQKLSRMPKGYDEDNPAAEYLKLKSFVGLHAISDADLTSKDLDKKILKSFEALQPLIEFINTAIRE